MYIGIHDDIIKWKHFPRYRPSVRGIHRSPVNSLHKGQWRRTLMFSLICTWINDWVNNGQAGDFRCSRTHYDVTVMIEIPEIKSWQTRDNLMAFFFSELYDPICFTHLLIDQSGVTVSKQQRNVRKRWSLMWSTWFWISFQWNSNS